jgi:hypothetical protein
MIRSRPIWLQRNATLNLRTLIRSAYLLYFSQPAAERSLLKAIRRKPIRSIVELGIGFSGRTKRLLEVASWRADCQPLRYTGIDLFEARPVAQGRVPLKHAFADLRLPEVRVQLVPGEPDLALRRVANSLTATDLLLISANQNEQALAQAWTWMPRMLIEGSLVFQEISAGGSGSTAWQALSLSDIQQRAAAASRSLRKAA